ncbi:hypothetical protein MBUL_02955 [Methylobacterium bullatum]|uniref:Uncharacterized protein n=1 Tax=Methylobacterium bullatum TaxID=570505 RepID=A0A679JF32_9HYPH|nr:hypothetical protein MBUL_02955 [Methylobacterium bullatum]
MNSTLRETAALIGEADGRDEDYVDYIHNQLKNMYAKGIIKSCGKASHGRTSSVLFDEVEIYRARVLSVLVEVGLNSQMLRDVRLGLDAESRKSSNGPNAVFGDHITYSFVEAVNGIKNGVDWNLEIAFFSVQETGTKEAWAFCAPTSQRLAGTLHHHHYVPPGAVPQVVTQVPLNGLLSGLIQRLAGN